MAESVKDIKKSAGHKNERHNSVCSPSVDILNRKNSILILADMPGVDEKSIEVTLERNLLTVYGMSESSVHDNLRRAISEYSTRDYKRVFTLSDDVDRDGIKATVKNGVLRLTLPKEERVRTRKIQITGEA